MTKQLISSEGGEYNAYGNTVRKEPKINHYDDGSSGMSMGFVVCECNEYVDDLAEIIAKALNAYDAKP